MKKFLVMAVMAVMAVTASAQVYLGGSVGFWRNSTAKTTEINILPEIGYKYSDNVAFGATLGWDRSQNWAEFDGDDYKVTSNVFEINPYVRYTFLSAGIVNLFCDGGIDLGFGKSKVEGESSDTAFVYGIGLRPGVSVTVSEKVSFVAHVGFLGYHGSNDAGEYVRSKGFGLGLDGRDLNIGFYYNF